MITSLPSFERKELPSLNEIKGMNGHLLEPLGKTFLPFHSERTMKVALSNMVAILVNKGVVQLSLQVLQSSDTHLSSDRSQTIPHPLQTGCR